MRRLPGKLRTRMYRWGAVSVITYLFLVLGIPGKKIRLPNPAVTASTRLMAESIPVIRRYREARYPMPGPLIDPNRTGLIGSRTSALTSTLGSLPAKRTTTNPQLAGWIAGMMVKSGIRQGQKVAIGASGSFPGLLIASLAAVESLNLRPVLIISLGSSSYGANDLHFHLLDILNLLNREGIFRTRATAVSLGGDRDIGADFPDRVRRELIEDIRRRDLPLILECDLRKNVTRRLEIYQNHIPDEDIVLFINIGGSYASLGEDSRILRLRPGLNTGADLPPPEKRGMIFTMLGLKIPCLHLLYIRGLVQQAGLPWDPVPLPESDRHYPLIPADSGMLMSVILLVAYFLLLTITWKIR